MGTPHKYADAIKAWADGETVQFRTPGVCDWKDLEPVGTRYSNPSFAACHEYRVKPDPYQHLKDAQAAGKNVQFFNAAAQRWDSNSGSPDFWLFSEDVERYRVVETEEIGFTLVGPMGTIEVKVNVEFSGNDVLDVKVSEFTQ